MKKIIIISCFKLGQCHKCNYKMPRGMITLTTVTSNLWEPHLQIRFQDQKSTATVLQDNRFTCSSLISRIVQRRENMHICFHFIRWRKG